MICYQIKSITERTPQECTVNDTWTGQVSKLLGSHFCENHLNDVSRSPDSSAHLAHQSPCKGSSIVADAEFTEQVEHGVYIKLFRSPAGHKYLRHVRFRYGYLMASCFLVLINSTYALLITSFAHLKQKAFHGTTSGAMVGRTPANPTPTVWYPDWRRYHPVVNIPREDFIVS